MRPSRLLSRLLSRGLAALGLLCAPAAAHAHLMPAHQGTVLVRDHRAFIALSLPAPLFAAADDDHDGRLSVEESSRHLELLQRLAITHVRVHDGSTEARYLHARVIVERADDATAHQPARDVLVLIVADFPSPPRSVSLAVQGLAGLGGLGHVRVRATRADGAGATEVFLLDGARPRAVFFRSPMARAAAAWREGAAHIVDGRDHLLFLLTLVLVGSGWRYWAGAVSGFTAAHALVLVLAARGRAPAVPPALTELLIAATIVAMALRALRRAGPMPAPLRVGHEALLAGVCGLVHGLGVAGAVRALVAGGTPDLVTLAAFNLGVEGAQLGVVAALVALLAAIGRLSARGERPRAGDPWLPARTVRAFSGAAACAGLAWMAARVPALW